MNPVRVKRRISPHHRRKTIVWKLVWRDSPGGVRVQKWQTVERHPEGNRSILLNLDDVPLYLQTLMGTDRRQKIVFLPWED